MKELKDIFIFLLLGIILVIVDNSSQEEQNKIFVDDQLLTQLNQAFKFQFDREPTDEELTNLLVSWYEDEVLYQEALSRGFDLDDEIVRRRLIQKYKDFIKTQAFNYVPTNEELKNFYDKNSVKYVEPFSISFSHNFFKTKNTNQTDIFFSGSSFSYVDQIKVDSTFGEGFFQKILENNGEKINSIYGWHEIKNLQIYPEKLISYEKVKDQVLNDFMLRRNAELYENDILKIRNKYELIFQEE
tara:strand:- start:153 stop:881 length:729 start_codon:yes stop_codon:yes gene_type:complete